MENSNGTPKTLDEAISQAVCIGPAKEGIENLYLHVKDFLAQKFGVAMLNAVGKDHEQALIDLFHELIRRE